MAVKTNAQLAAFFETGDQPSQVEFGHLIDTIQPASVTLADTATIALTAATHGYRTVFVPNIGQTTTITLPVPVLDTWFHLVYLPGASDGNTLRIYTDSSSNTFFHGAVIHADTNIVDSGSTGAAAVIAVHGEGSADDDINLASGDHLDIWFHAISTTVWKIWGVSAGDTPITITNDQS